MSKDLRFTREENNGSVRLKLFGELDIYTSQELKKIFMVLLMLMELI